MFCSLFEDFFHFIINILSEYAVNTLILLVILHGDFDVIKGIKQASKSIIN